MARAGRRSTTTTAAAAAVALAACLALQPASGASIEGRLTVPPSLAAAWAAAGVSVSKHVAGVGVSLNGGEVRTVTRGDGGFAFHNVSAARVYLLEVASTATVWPTYKVQVPAAGGDGVAVVEYRYPGAPKIPVSHPIMAAPVALPLYFEERPRMSVWGFLKNPQMLIMLAVGAMMLCLPAMQKNMDPETRAEMEAQQAAMANPMEALTRMFGGGGAAPAPAAPAAARTLPSRIGGAGAGGGGGGAGGGGGGAGGGKSAVRRSAGVTGQGAK